MPRRVSLPTADDLFRPTVVPDPVEDGTDPVAATSSDVRDAAAEPDKSPGTGSGRVRHDEKMTVYITSEELLDIEHARLTLRRHHALGVDRGRLVRAAVAFALADLEANGGDSVLVQRLGPGAGETPTGAPINASGDPGSGPGA
ncbi:MAG: hypothetical protein WBQ50_00950 [Nocardioides sp.]